MSCALSRDLSRAQARLNAAIDDAGGTTPCLDSWEWTEEAQAPMVTRALIAECHTCPVLAECSTVAELLPAMDKAHTVMAGRRYDAAGRPIALGPVAAKTVKDWRRRQARQLDQLDQLDNKASEASEASEVAA